MVPRVPGSAEAPDLAALLAWPLLGQLPGLHELAGMALAVLGLVLSRGAAGPR